MARYAVFSDVHGNLEAYKSFLDTIQKEDCSRNFCAGDIVGYGADPRECILLTRQLAPVVVCGNHDWGSVDLTSIEYFNDNAKQAVLWTASILGDDEKEYLKGLPLSYTDDELTMVHGTLMRPESFDYILDFKTAYQMMKMMPTRMAFIGHSHVPGIFSLKDDRISYTAEPKLAISDDMSYLINVGSIGQPRDGDWRPSYCIWDKDQGTIELKRIAYDVKKAQEKIIEAGLPEYLASRLSEGR